MAKTIHGLTIGCLIIFGLGTNFGGVFLVGIGIAAGILAWEHQLVKPDDLSRVDAAFFMMNGIMSLVVFTAALIDRMI
jgi:4-hydroxybenzoate polyprenyltransferase